MTTNLKLYYNTNTDELGIAGDGWDYLCLCKFIPVVRSRPFRSFPNGKDPLTFVPHEIAEPFTADWHYIGDF